MSLWAATQGGHRAPPQVILVGGRCSPRELPVRERSVGSGQTRAVSFDWWIFRECGFVELNSQPWLSRRQHETVFERDLHREQVRENFPRNTGTFLHGKVAGGQVQVQTGGR